MSPHKNSPHLLRDTVAIVFDSPADGNISNAQLDSYPLEVVYFIASFIVLISLCHFISLCYRFITREQVHDWKPRSTVSLRRVPTAIIDSFRTIAFRWMVPIGSSRELSLAEVGLTIGYMAVLFTWTFVNTTSTTGYKFDPNYYADRAGHIAATQFPILIALGMRNNFISFLTGVSFIKLNFLHRMTARVLCVLIWIHAGGRFLAGLVGVDALANSWLQWGIVAASSLTLLCLLTIRPIRERNYEQFMIVHFIFAFIAVLGIYFHLKGRQLAYFGAWPSMLLWGFEHFIRLIRLAMINFGYLNPWSSKSSKNALDAMVEVLSPHLVRVTICRPKYFHWRPGHSASLSFPLVSAFPFESHPFTISTIDDDNSTSSDKVLVFLICVRNGITRKLLKAASPDQKYEVFVNGPYGSPPLLIGDQTVILIAGGSGVAFTLPLFLNILRQAKAGKKICQKVLFIWAIRGTGPIHWIENALAAALLDIPSSISITVQLYITATTNTKEWNNDSRENGFEFKASDSSESASLSGSTIVQSPFVQVHQGRPDFKPLISKEVDEATGGISINVCGTHSLANAARKAVNSPRPMDVLRGGPTVTLHVEAFGS